MKTMKSLIVGLALFIGIVGVSHAGGRQGQGWNVTIVTGTAWDVAGSSQSGTRVFLRKIILSSGTTGSLGDFMQVFSTPPNSGNGAGVSLMPTSLTASTTALTPPLIFLTTGTTGGTSYNPYSPSMWTIGDCEVCFLETTAIHVRKTAEASGAANTAAVYWSR